MLEKDKDDMAETLRAIASSMSKLRELLKESKKDLHRIQLLLDDLDAGLKSLWPSADDVYAAGLVTGTSATENTGRETNYKAVFEFLTSRGQWKEALAVVATGRIVGIAAEADEALIRSSSSSTTDIRERLWVADGKRYARWLGTGAVWILDLRSNNGGEIDATQETRESAAAQLLGKGMNIGYLDDIVEQFTWLMFSRRQEPVPTYCRLLGYLTSMERRRFLNSLLRYLAKLSSAEQSSNMTDKSDVGPKKKICAIAKLLQSITNSIPSLLNLLLDHLTSHPQDMTIVRAALASLSPASRMQVLQKTWSQFSDKIHIQHTAILSQEANGSVLLLAAGYVNRDDATALIQQARSSLHNTGVSERLKSSSERVRWLGMCIGMAISKLVDEEDKRMDFGVEEMHSEEAKLFRGLVELRDSVGTVEDVVNLFRTPEIKNKELGRGSAAGNSAMESEKKSRGIISAKTASSSKSRIIEVVDDSNEEDDDLVPYAKPDSDDPDSDEDATMVNRDKPKAPMYIRDLIANLSDTSNAAAHTLALQTAPTLIRRKANFGSELHDLTTELAQCLVSLQDQLGTENWHELRQSALISLVICEPMIMGPWLAKTLFEGDLSISQRIAVITAMGLGGRELAGFKTDDDGQVAKIDVEQAAKAKQEQFPTKKLPGKMHEIYSNGWSGSDGNNAVAYKERQLKLESRRVEGLTRKMEQMMLRPLNTKQISRPRPRKKMLKNDLASMVADHFFFPLTRYWQVYSQSSTRANNPLKEPILISLTLKTLSLLITAAGPATISLPQLTKELFTLLLHLRSLALRHPPVLEAALFALLALLDIHAHETLSAQASGLRWLAEECGSSLVELREWVGIAWERLGGDGAPDIKISTAAAAGSGGGDGETDEETKRCKALAASAAVKTGEVIQSYQRLLAGELVRT